MLTSNSKKTKKTVSKKMIKTAQDFVPYESVYPNGMIGISSSSFCKMYYFGDINFEVETEDRQISILENYGKLLNKFAANITMQICIINRKADIAEVEKKFFVPAKADEYQDYRKEYNDILGEKIREGRNDILRERYIVITINNTDVIAAQKTFGTLDIELKGAMANINMDGVQELSVSERLHILHDLFKNPTSENFSNILSKFNDGDGNFSLSLLNKRGVTTKDIVAPDIVVRNASYLQLGEELVVKTYAINDMPVSIDTKFLSQISAIPCAMITSVIFKSLPRRDALRLCKNQTGAIKSEVVKANQKAIKENYDPSLISEELQTSREEAEELMKDLTVNNQKLFFVTLTVSIYAKNKDELKEFESLFKMRLADFYCQLNPLYDQQIQGFRTSLPFAQSYIGIDRMLVTDSACAMLPFSIQELMDKGGHFYGVNSLTRNMILCNRRALNARNGLVFGRTGSGKSFLVKGEMVPNLLDTEDSLIILDPDGEYVKIAKEFHGIVIDLSSRGKEHINPLDLDMDYFTPDDDRDDPVKVKADYMVSLCEAVIGDSEVLTPYQINVIHKCTRKIYESYVRIMDESKEIAIRDHTPIKSIDYEAAPTLMQFYEALLDDNSAEGHMLAQALEPYCLGDYNIFSYKTNINPDNRIIVYNLKHMPQNMRTFAMKVCLSDIWNRVVKNQETNEKLKAQAVSMGQKYHEKAIWVYLDEFYLMVQSANSAQTLQMYYKRIRKYVGIMTGITQDVEDLLSIPEGRGIFQNTGFVLMMNQGNIGREELREQFSIPESLLDYIKDKPTGTGLLYNGRTLIPFDYRIPNGSKLFTLMSTKVED